MLSKKTHYNIFKKKMHVVKSLVNDAQALIPASDLESARRLVITAKLVMPSEYDVARAKKEAPLLMSLRGETSKSSKAAVYRKVIDELEHELNELFKKHPFLDNLHRRNRVA